MAQSSGEAEEAALHLATTDRQRLQVALSALGFDTRGSDGVLGPRSREMIAAWQKAHNHPETGYLTAPQSQALLREAQPALQRFDEDKRKPTAPSRRQPAASAASPAPRIEYFP
ncbi:MAG: peptidoglycan-binding domain-containing protein [Reyranella sp.]